MKKECLFWENTTFPCDLDLNYQNRIAGTLVILAIYGSGGLGREVLDVAVRRNALSHKWDRIVFIDDFAPPGHFYATERVSFDRLMQFREEAECVIAVGEPSAREHLFDKLMSASIKLITLVDPSCVISSTANIGLGSVLMERVVVKADVTVADNVLLQPFANIGHDIVIGAHSVMSPYASPGGATVFGKRVFVGMHASILEGLSIGDDSIIGMGSAVFRDVPSGVTVLGNPARPTRGNDEGKVFR